MIFMKQIIFVLLWSVLIFPVFSQQDAMFTHYMYNTLEVNPAYAGSRDALTATMLHRSQWVGFKGAPVTQTITLHAPVYEDKVNLGLSVINDKIGPTNNTSINVDYAFRFQLTEDSKLALGLKAGLNSMYTDLANLKLDKQLDPSFQGKANGEMSPNFGFGVYYSRDRFYAGFSIPRLIESSFNFSQGITDYTISKEQRHYFFIAGGMYKLSENFDLKPTTFVKVTNGAPVQADVTASVVYQEKLLLGAMCRTGDAAGILAGLDLTDQLHVGYSFDWSFVNSTTRYNYGSHEIMLRYDFVFPGKFKIRSPRYF